MKEDYEYNITNILGDLEQKYNVQILFAVESGSRLWRIESIDSDYDVRFVYRKPLLDYLAIHPSKDVIEHTKSIYDFSGFDLYKFIRLLNQSNPSMIEWLNSDIIYVDHWLKRTLMHLINENFNPISLYCHYKSMCKNNYLTYLKSEKLMTYKKYLYAMRGLVNAKYVQQFLEVPPIKFEEAVKKVTLPFDVKEKLREIIDLKKQGIENDRISQIHLFERYIEDFLEEHVEIQNKKFSKTKELQEKVYEILGVEYPGILFKEYKEKYLNDLRDFEDYARGED